jgi:hypothetical protein
MTLERKIARTFALGDATWLYHAPPWSVILRFTGFSFLILAFWSRFWFGSGRQSWLPFPCSRPGSIHGYFLHHKRRVLDRMALLWKIMKDANEEFLS